MSVGFSSTKVGGYGHLFLWLLTTGLSQFLLMWVSLPGPSNMVTDFHCHKKENNSRYVREKPASLWQSNFRDKPLFLRSAWPRWVPSSAHIQGEGITVPGNWVPWVCAVNTCGSQWAPVCSQSDDRHNDVTHMQQNGRRMFIAHIMALSGKSRADTKARLGWPERKEKQVPRGFYCGEDSLGHWVWMVWASPPAWRNGGPRLCYPVALKWDRRGWHAWRWCGDNSKKC